MIGNGPDDGTKYNPIDEAVTEIPIETSVETMHENTKNAPNLLLPICLSN